MPICKPGATQIETLDAFQAMPGAQATAAAAAVGRDTLLVAGHAATKNALTWVVRRARAVAPTVWETVDLVPGHSAASAVVFNQRAFYVAGVQNGWLVRSSPTGESGTWSRADRFAEGSAVPHAAAAANLSVFVVGEVDFKDDSPGAWVVRVRRGEGPWSSADVFRLEEARTSRASAVATRGSVVVVAGSGRGAGGRQTWVVRKSDDDGRGWATVDTVAGAVPYDVAVGENGEIVVAGARMLSKSSRAWLVRISRDGGATWSTLGSGDIHGGRLTVPYAVEIDTSGAIYVGGSVQAEKRAVWSLRKWASGAKAFETVDDYRSGRLEAADKIEALVLDPRGKILAVGDIHENARTWIVRGYGCGTRPGG